MFLLTESTVTRYPVVPPRDSVCRRRVWQELREAERIELHLELELSEIGYESIVEQRAVTQERLYKFSR